MLSFTKNTFEGDCFSRVFIRPANNPVFKHYFDYLGKAKPNEGNPEDTGGFLGVFEYDLET